MKVTKKTEIRAGVSNFESQSTRINGVETEGKTVHANCEHPPVVGRATFTRLNP